MKVDAFASAITAHIGRVAIAEACRENSVQPQEMHWQMHPAQRVSVSILFETVAINDLESMRANPKELDSLEDIETVRRLAKEYMPDTFLSLKIQEDLSMRTNQIDLRDDKGNLLGTISNLAVPNGFETPWLTEQKAQGLIR